MAGASQRTTGDDSRMTLHEFIEKIKAYQAEIAHFHQRNESQDEFRATFWTSSEEFTLARSIWIASGGSISHEVTKVSLVGIKQKDKEDVALSSVCQALLSPCDQLMTALRVGLFTGTGYVLSRAMIRHTQKIMQGIEGLGHALLLDPSTNNIPELTGRLWESCKQCPTLPTSNQSAIKRHLMTCMGTIKDTLVEFQQSVVESEQQQRASSEEPEAFEMMDGQHFDDFDFDFTSDSWSEVEMTRVREFIQVLEMLMAIVKRGLQQLVRVDASEAGSVDETILDWIRNVHHLYDQLQDVVVDIGPGFYPPHEPSMLRTQLETLNDRATHCLEKLLCFPVPFRNDAQELGRGKEALSRQIQALDASLAKTSTHVVP